jgi:hypothetical protein
MLAGRRQEGHDDYGKDFANCSAQFTGASDRVTDDPFRPQPRMDRDKGAA